MGGGAQIKGGITGVKEWLTQSKRGEWERRKEKAQDTSRTGQREREGSGRPPLGHSPLGWLGENATAHYMLYLCSVDEQCTITLPRCSSSHTAVCLRGSRYCCYRGLPANSPGAHQTSHTLLPKANPGLCLETKAPYEFAYMKGEEKQERLLQRSEQTKQQCRICV